MQGQLHRDCNRLPSASHSQQRSGQRHRLLLAAQECCRRIDRRLAGRGQEAAESDAFKTGTLDSTAASRRSPHREQCSSLCGASSHAQQSAEMDTVPQFMPPGTRTSAYSCAHLHPPCPLTSKLRGLLCLVDRL